MMMGQFLHKLARTIEIRKALAELSTLNGRVGWFETAKYPDGTPVAYVAAIQEFGSGPIPPRPFMRPTAEARRPLWSKLAADQARLALSGNVTAAAMVERLGLQMAGDISKTISKLTTPQLSPTTIELRRRARSGQTITGKSVGAAAKAVGSGAAPVGKAGASENKPLVFTGILLATLTSAVGAKP